MFVMLPSNLVFISLPRRPSYQRPDTKNEHQMPIPFSREKGNFFTLNCMLIIHPPTKLREGNVFSIVCMSVHGGSHASNLTVQGPPAWNFIVHEPPPLARYLMAITGDLFKLVHFRTPPHQC